MALPTLMGLPTECRLQIYSYVFQSEMPEIVIHHEVKYHEGFWTGNNSGKWYRGSHAASNELVRTTIHHPLLYVSRQTRVEALDRYQIKLIMNELRPPYEYAAMDDWMVVFSEEVRKAITDIEIGTVPIIDHLVVNKKNFPNLRRFTTCLCPDSRLSRNPIYRRFTNLRDLEAATTLEEVKRSVIEQKQYIEDNDLYNHPFSSGAIYEWSDDDTDLEDLEDTEEDADEQSGADISEAEAPVERDWELYLRTNFNLSCDGPEERSLEMLWNYDTLEIVDTKIEELGSNRP